MEDSKRNLNRQISEREYRDGATVLESRPRALFVELTRRCNLHCPMCRSAGSVDPKQNMSDALFRQISEELFDTAEIVDLRGWGESLLLPDFLNRASIAVDYGCSIRVVTNLSYHNNAALDWLSQHRAYIGISLDASNSGQMGILRPGASLRIIEQNMRRLAKMYEETNSIDRLNVYVTCQRPNVSEIPDILTLVASTGIRRVSLSPVSISPDHELSLVGINTDSILERAAETGKRLGLHVSLTASLTDAVDVTLSTSACIHPWTYAYFAFDGRVGFCDHLIGPAAETYLLGNLMAESFERIWNGSAWTDLRQEHLNMRRADAPHFEECAWCYRNRYTDFEDLLDPELSTKRRAL